MAICYYVDVENLSISFRQTEHGFYKAELDTYEEAIEYIRKIQEIYGVQCFYSPEKWGDQLCYKIQIPYEDLLRIKSKS